MSQAQAALEHHDYDRAQTLLEQAKSQYDRLPPVQTPADLLTAYDELANAGVQAGADLDLARQRSLRWADYPMARAAALAAGAGYARLGDDEGLVQTQDVLQALDSRQRRLVLLFGGLALLTGAWLALWLWARGRSPSPGHADATHCSVPSGHARALGAPPGRDCARAAAAGRSCRPS